MTGTASIQETGFQFDPQKIANIVKSLLSDPKSGWENVKNEFSSVKSIYLNLILPILALVAICNFIKLTIIGVSIPLVGIVRVPVETGLNSALGLIIMQSVMMYVAAMILTKLAPSFQGATDELRALRLVAFTGAVGSISAILILVPFIGLLLNLIVGIYSIYIFFCGITPMTNVPKEKRIPYALVVILCNIIIGFVFYKLLGFIGIHV